MTHIRAVVLAAGKGTRLKPVTDRMPKVMIPVRGKPLLEHHVEGLAHHGIDEIYINLHYLPDLIKAYFSAGAKWGVRIRYSMEPEILGTAGAVKKLEKELAGGPFLVVYGDNLHGLDYGAFIRYAEDKRGLASVAVFDKKDVAGSGILEFDDSDRIVRFKEKPAPDEVFSHWVNAGVYWLDPGIFSHIPKGVSDFSSDIFPALLREGHSLFAYRMDGDVVAIDNMELFHRVLGDASTDF